jgi:hypothetical protein
LHEAGTFARGSRIAVGCMFLEADFVGDEFMGDGFVDDGAAELAAN